MYLKEKYHQKLKLLLNYNKSLSTCAYVKVGSVLATINGKVIAEGYNGTPSKVIECNEIDTLLLLLGKSKISLKDFAREVLKQYKILSLKNNKHNLALLFFILETITSGELKEFIGCLKDKYLKHPRTYNINEFLITKQLQLLIQHADEYKNLNDKEIRKKLNYIHSRFENHAEKNLIQTLKMSSIEVLNNTDLVLFVSYTPCFECTKFLNEVFPSIREIYYEHEYIDRKYNESTIDYWNARNVQIIKIG